MQIHQNACVSTKDGIFLKLQNYILGWWLLDSMRVSVLATLVLYVVCSMIYSGSMCSNMHITKLTHLCACMNTAHTFGCMHIHNLYMPCPQTHHPGGLKQKHDCWLLTIWSPSCTSTDAYIELSQLTPAQSVRFGKHQIKDARVCQNIQTNLNKFH